MFQVHCWLIRCLIVDLPMVKSQNVRVTLDHIACVHVSVDFTIDKLFGEANNGPPEEIIIVFDRFPRQIEQHQTGRTTMIRVLVILK